MGPNVRSAMKVMGAVALVAIVLVVAYAFSGSRGADMASVPVEGSAPQYSREEVKVAPDSFGTGDGAAGLDSDPTPPTPGDKRLVIRMGDAQLRVDDLESALERVRVLAARHEAEIADLYLDAGPDGGVRPMEGPVGPANATVTLRVPTDRLDALIGDLDDIGTVLRQSTSSSDVTEEYVDLSARLKNLKAEEARLRDFFERADDVEGLLAVQRELSRVRGEIEAMEARVTYLERQAARATFTISMTEPGPLVRPSGVDWGIRDALTRGLQGAVALLTATITALIAASPLLVAAFLAWLLVRLVRRARSKRDGDALDDETGV